MAVRFSGLPQPVPDTWTVEEDATSLDREEAPSGVPLVQASATGSGRVLGSRGQVLVVDSPVYGRTSARVTDTEESDSGWSVSGGSPLSRLLQVGGVRPARRADATEAVRRFFSAVSYTDYTLVVDPALSARRFVVPAGYDDVWGLLRRWLSANELDLAWVIDRLYLYPWRSRAVYLQDVTGSFQIAQEEGSMARAINVDVYHRTAFDTAVVYPPRLSLYPGRNKWLGDEKFQAISVESGEQTTVTIRLNVEVSEIRQPVMIKEIPVSGGVAAITPATHPNGAYMVVGKDNKPIMPAQWRDMGGGLTVTLNKDRKSVDVSITGMAFPDLSPFRVCESDGKNDYPGLFLVGVDGSAVDIEVLKFDTGASGTDEVREISNPAVSDRSLAYRAAQAAADNASGHSMTLSWSGPDPVRSGFGGMARQSFGRLAGTRFLLRGHWWRANQATFSDSGVSLSAERDTTLGDLARVYPTVGGLVPGGRTLGELSDMGVL